MQFVFRRHLFSWVGGLSICLYFFVTALDRSGNAGFFHLFAALLRLLIVPAYLVWLLLTMVYAAIAGPHGLQGALGLVVSFLNLLAGLAPYALLDYLRNRRRSIPSAALPPATPTPPAVPE